MTHWYPCSSRIQAVQAPKNAQSTAQFVHEARREPSKTQPIGRRPASAEPVRSVWQGHCEAERGRARVDVSVARSAVHDALAVSTLAVSVFEEDRQRCDPPECILRSTMNSDPSRTRRAMAGR